ncbi:metallophosphoesterase [Demequina lutea]|uniref:Putative MPP superfamily phosphohydrolase n=1 Tax=Demequina lutea TaxID=431489 RepID=A0A7Y9ZBW4_9MICO|nr:metallophosphoesterase [Demequina lutea]NYI42534.1 putative MPP superfamily phosphohydrolase [Demequina lutea]
MSRLLGVAVGVAAAGVACVGWGVAEAHAFTTRRVAVPVLEPGATPIRVLHVSDLHFTTSQRDKVAWASSLAKEAPDLVVVTGDNLGHPDAVPTVAEALAPLLGLPGLFVFGSNDYVGPRPVNPFAYFGGPSRIHADRTPLPTEDLRAVFVDAGWKDLNNARAVITVAGVEVTAVGMDDPHIGRDAMPAPDGDRGALHLGVVHAPYARALQALTDDDADIMFAGHTHGGQVCVPGFGALVTNCDLDRRRVKGLSSWPGALGDPESTWLHVSAGAGTSPYAPVRFACRPEATVLTLVAKA